ncbi:universal stress protein [Streptomyces sp. CAU 1734]|uniref:universal stress protein n=1 Tax=Streptomyces sp. CAU 1734 TaxID=3140360 RepID=UPI003261ABE1
MSRTVTVGIDGSRESLAAAEWAAREAKLRELPLRVVNVREPVPFVQAPFLGDEDQRKWTEYIPREAAEGLRRRHPELEITSEQLKGRPGDVLTEAAAEADLLVLGSSGLSSFGGFLVGSVGQAVVSRTERPVVLVRAPEAGEHDRLPAADAQVPPIAPDGPVVLGLDANAPDELLIGFAFAEAARRDAPLRVVHSWNLPPYFAYGLPPDPELDERLGAAEAAALSAALDPWRRKYPAVEVVEQAEPGRAVDQLVAASDGASLLVVGRRIRRATAFGGRIGSVAHAVLHHSAAPVAVIPHP